jgi:hypothetical protein
MVPPPFGAVRAPARQLVDGVAGSARVTPAGRISVKARSVIGREDPLVMTKDRYEALPGPIVDGEKLLEKVG